MLKVYNCPPFFFFYKITSKIKKEIKVEKTMSISLMIKWYLSDIFTYL